MTKTEFSIYISERN